MSTKKSIALRAAVLLGVLSALPLSGQAWGGHGGRGHGGAHGHGPEMMGTRIVRQLDLPAAQRDQIFAIVDRYQPTLRKLEFNLGDRRQALHEVLVAGSFDATRVEQEAAAQGQAAQELYLTKARMLSEIGAVLTPEQRARLERRSDRPGRHGPR